MRNRSVLGVALLAAAVTASLSLGACGGNGSASSGNNGAGSSPAATSPTIVTAGDAPMSSVLAALVTVSAVSFTSSSGSVQLLSQPRNLELTHLGGIREPLDLHALPEGTYSSLSLTVTAAQITYMDPNTNQVVVANAVIPSANATTSITLTNPLVVSDSGATDVRFDFDLQKSLDLTNSVVTFTPSISAAVARAKDEDGNGRLVFVDGTVTAVSTSANTITLTTHDTGLSVTLNVNSSTKFDDNVTLATLQVGAVVQTRDQLQSDGSLTALMVEDNDGGASEDSNSRVDAGIVTSVTRDSNNTLTSFSMMVRNSSNEKNEGHALTVNIGQGTSFKNSMEAQSAGLAAFDQTQVFPGAAVRVSGTISDSTTVVARAIRPAQVFPTGLTTVAVQSGGNGGFVITMLLDNTTFFAKNAGIGNLTVNTNANTVFDGGNLSATNVANLAVGSPLVARGFFSSNGTTTVLFAAGVHEESH